MATIPVNIKINVFAEQSITGLHVTLDTVDLYHNDIPANSTTDIDINEQFTYQHAGWKTLNITWRGDTECANKLLQVQEITILDQVIDVYGIKQFPQMTPYIQSLSEQEIRDKLLNSTGRYGWYGDYRIDVFIGDQQDYVKRYAHPSKIMGFIGNKIITNPAHVKATRLKHDQ